MTRLVGDQLEQHQAKVALFEDPLRPLATAHAAPAVVAPAEAVAGEVGALMVVVTVKTMHSYSFLDISLS